MQTGPREKKKKISIRFVPNKVAGSKVIKRKNKKFYPAYVGVTFNRKTTTFPYEQSSLFQWFMDEEGENFICVTKPNEEIIQSLDKSRMNKNLDRLTAKLIQQIEYEYGVFGDKYRIAGVHQRVLQYDKKLSVLISKEIEEEFLEFLKDRLTYRQFSDVEAWKQEQSKKDLWFSLFPSDILFYLTEKAKLLSLSDIPVFIREKIYVFSSFLSYQEFRSSLDTHTKILSLFDWLSDPTIQSSFLNYISQDLEELQEIKSYLLLENIYPSKTLEYLQSILNRVVNNISK